MRAASVILHDAQGNAVKVGSSVTLRGSGSPAMVVGYDGIVYLEGLSAHNVLEVQTAHGNCTANFDYRRQGKDVPVIGPLTCREDKP